GRWEGARPLVGRGGAAGRARPVRALAVPGAGGGNTHRPGGGRAARARGIAALLRAAAPEPAGGGPGRRRLALAARHRSGTRAAAAGGDGLRGPAREGGTPRPPRRASSR